MNVSRLPTWSKVVVVGSGVVLAVGLVALVALLVLGTTLRAALRRR